jgi:hypothetical protein
MKASRCFVLFGLALLTFACSSTQSPNPGIPETGVEYPPWIGPVEVYFEKPSMGYEKLGVVSAQGTTKQQLTDLVAKLQKKAALLGANGIIVYPATTSTTAIIKTKIISFEKSKLHLMATAIRKEQSCSSPPESTLKPPPHITW